jgi:hypothetical protein
MFSEQNLFHTHFSQSCEILITDIGTWNVQTMNVKGTNERNNLNVLGVIKSSGQILKETLKVMDMGHVAWVMYSGGKER